MAGETTISFVARSTVAPSKELSMAKKAKKAKKAKQAKKKATRKGRKVGAGGNNSG